MRRRPLSPASSRSWLARASSALCVASVGVAAGCGTASGAGPTVAARDSAGVRIVENRGTSALRELGWRLDPEPRLEIGGGADPASELYKVTGAVRLGDGRIVVVNAGTNELRVFGPDGRHLRSVGREGEGPGEFRGLFWAGSLPGDSIVAWDAALQRLSVFGPAGELVRSVRPERPLGLFPQVKGLFSDGRLVVSSAGALAGLPGSGVQVRRDSAAFRVLGVDGGVSAIGGAFPGTETVVLRDPSAGLLVRPLPFGRQTVTAVHGRRLYVGTGDRFEVAAYEPDGGLRLLVRADREPARVTGDDVREYQRSLVTVGGDARVERQQARILEQVPYPDVMPAVSGLQVDSEGHLWVEEPQKPGDRGGATWLVFSPEGRALGTLRLPQDLSVKQIGSDWILGVVLDDDQKEHVRLHHLARTGSSRGTS